MTFNIVSNVTYITGKTGTWDNKVKNADVKYGRNAVGNYYDYLNELGFGTSAKLLHEPTDKDPSANFNLKYLPEEKADKTNLNKMALLGAAFADLGSKMSMSVEDMNKIVKNAFGEKTSVSAFDINNDGQIDVSENAVAFVIKDMADKTPTEEAAKNGKLNLSADDIDGTITNVGENNFGAFLNSEKAEANKKVITQIHQILKLDEAKNIFASDANNTAV